MTPNKFLAKIASDWRKPDGLFVIQPRDADAFLAPLPVERVTEASLKGLGVRTVGDLQGYEQAALETLLGRYGARLH